VVVDDWDELQILIRKARARLKNEKDLTLFGKVGKDAKEKLMETHRLGGKQNV